MKNKGLIITLSIGGIGLVALAYFMFFKKQKPIDLYGLSSQLPTADEITQSSYDTRMPIHLPSPPMYINNERYIESPDKWSGQPIYRPYIESKETTEPEILTPKQREESNLAARDFYSIRK